MDGQGSGTDRELVREYAVARSEAAFRALVSRHVNLVHGTVLRQVGDAGVAEEVTQNVFVALARKAPRLAGHETLAGWLHRTAVLEAKARIRAELRRRRREEVASALAVGEREGSGGGVGEGEDLALLLDEALLSLREGDRLALVLRFLEERSLRDVGGVLGVDEDAARKRVSRALERLTGFFRARGFALPAAGGVASVLGQSAASGMAPAGLVATAAGAGWGAGGGVSAGGSSWLLFQIMSLTKTQTAWVCVVLAGVPLAWQERVVGGLARERAGLEVRAEERAGREAALEAEIARGEAALRRVSAETLEARGRLAEREARAVRGAGAVEGETGPGGIYRWEDEVPLVRVPKAMIRQRPPSGVRGKRGELSPEIRAVLQLDEREVGAVEAALRRFLADYHALGEGVVQEIEPTSEELRGHPREEVRAFGIAGILDQVTARRDRLFDELRGELDADRADVLIRSLDDFVPLEAGVGFHSGRSVWPNDHRVGFFRLPPGAQAQDTPLLGLWITEPGRGSLSGVIDPGDMPPYLQGRLADWIAEAKDHHARKRAADATAREEER